MNAPAEPVHILLVTERELPVLGALYALGLMAALLPKVGTEHAAGAFAQVQAITSDMLDIEDFHTLANRVRDHINELAEDDAERQDAVGG